MSDTRFTLLGVGVIFAGFVVFSIFGTDFAAIEAQEFDDCYRYSEDAEPVKVSCEAEIQAKIAFGAGIMAVIGAGIVLLVKGIRGGWDQKVRPEDMVGPGNTTRPDDDAPDKKTDES